MSDQDAIFPRSDYSLLWITLTSDEILGILDSSYLEDYHGVNGQITLRQLSTGAEVTVLMGESTSPYPHEVFTGYAPLSSLTNDTYQIQGRVRDVLGNVSILGAYYAPTGGERIRTLQFLIAIGTAKAIQVGSLVLIGGHLFSVQVTSGLPALAYRTGAVLAAQTTISLSAGHSTNAWTAPATSTIVQARRAQ